MMRVVSYSKEEMNIVEGGISEIQRVLMGNDSDKKRRLLETVVVSDNESDVIEDALQLLRNLK